MKLLRGKFYREMREETERLSRIGTEVDSELLRQIRVNGEELPDWKLQYLIFSYNTKVSPDRSELKNVSEYLETAYGMKVLNVKNRLSSGGSWTDENAEFTVEITLVG